jgi:hypothetical protein
MGANEVNLVCHMVLTQLLSCTARFPHERYALIQTCALMIVPEWARVRELGVSWECVLLLVSIDKNKSVRNIPSSRIHPTSLEKVII